MKTHVIDKIVDPDSGKTIKKINKNVVGTPISENTATQVRDYLETVISGEHGTGKNYAIEGYQVAGKTGTAQIPGNGGYLTGASNYIFSFLGMAPKDDPELIMYVAVQQPELKDYADGSIPVSKIFNSVMKNSLQYLQIKPSDQNKVETAPIPNVIGLTVDEATNQLTEKGMKVVVVGNGSNITNQIPVEKESLLVGEKVVLKTDGELTAPDMSGWSLRDVMKVAEIANMKLNSVGSGYVVKQNVNSGSLMKEGEFLIVDLDKPSEKKEPIEEDSESKDEIKVKD